MNDYPSFATAVLKDIDQSPTPFHAVDTLSKQLLDAGFVCLKEQDDWQLDMQQNAGGRYFITRNGSSLIAFVLGKQNTLHTGLRLVGAHTDSPCLKIKPNAILRRKNYLQLGVEVYGGALLHPWFDRDLALAGRVSFVNAQQHIESRLLNDKRALAMIPSLAIHLNREANSSNTLNAQKHLAPILALDTSVTSFEEILREQIRAQYGDLQLGTVLDFEMSLYDRQPGSLLGLNQELVCSARLDNLLSCFIGVQSLLAANGEITSVLVCNDHEEVGSNSACGAQGPMLRALLQRLFVDASSLARVIDRSMMVSVDNAHAVHPNYSELHEPQHMPLLNHGPVLKMNANQRYASNSETQAVFAHCCEQVGIKLQRFVMRSDLACGSTIGPITATNLGIATVDVGIPSLAMHSIRETAGTKDLLSMRHALTAFLNKTTLWATQ